MLALLISNHCVQKKSDGRLFIYTVLPYFYYGALISGPGLYGVYEEPSALTSAFEAAAARMVAALPQAKLTVAEVTDMLVEKHGKHRHNMGSITKKRPNSTKKKDPKPVKLDAEGNEVPARVARVVPPMFTREAARSMA
jgi:hypothetical protein